MSPRRPAPGVPYWRLSGFYFFYFATLGGLIPYWGLFLQRLGFQPAEIGELLAIVAGTKIVAPNIWGWVADRSGSRMGIVRLASLLALLCFTGVFFGQSYWWLALNMILFSFFWNASLPQFEANTLNWLAADSHRYSVIRLWGSIGFILLATGLGPVLDATDPLWLPSYLVVLYGAIWLASVSVPESPPGELASEGGGLRWALRQPGVLALLGVCFLMQLSHGAYYAFYSIFLQDYGYSKTSIGLLWALGVVAEILVFLWMRRLLPRFGARGLLLTSLALTALRWVLVGQFAAAVGVLAFAQALHAASFGIYHAVAIELVHRWFRGASQGRGQALYSSLSFGAGGALGSLLAGHLWGLLGGESTFLVFATFAVAALALAWLRLRRLPV